MPTAQGPCRFGQYAPYLRQILDANGHDEVEILSPTSQNAYDGLGSLAKPFVRTGWRALLCADLLQKLLLHPPSVRRTPRRYRSGLRRIAWPIYAARSRRPPVEPAVQLEALRESMVRTPRPLPAARRAPRPQPPR